MSNPTPPGDTTPPASTSVAATPPMGNPYPQCTSGMAYDAPTMPGNVATFATCSSVRSPATSGNSSADANTWPGTRIASWRSMRHRHGDSSISVIPVRSVLRAAIGRPLIGPDGNLPVAVGAP